MGQIENLKKLGLTDEEVAEVLADDRRIERGEKLFELTLEQKKASKAAKNVKSYAKSDRKPKEKKTDLVKSGIIAAIVDCLTPQTDCLEVKNSEREVFFTKNGEKYTITLTKHRK